MTAQLRLDNKLFKIFFVIITALSFLTQSGNAQVITTLEEAYKTLDIAPDSSASIVKRAFNKLILAYHPDKHSDATAEEQKAFEQMSAQIINAYEFIKEHAPIFKATRKPPLQESRYTYGILAEPGTLLYAVQTGDVKKVEELLKSGEPANDIDDLGWSPLHHAAYLGQSAITKLLSTFGALLNSPTLKNKWSPLYLATVMLKPETAEILLKAGARPNTLNQEGQTPLIAVLSNFYASTDKNEVQKLEKLVQLFITHKANLNVQDPSGRTALHYAAKNGLQPVVKMLIESGANPNIQDSQQKTALQLASTREIRKYLKPVTTRWWQFWKKWTGDTQATGDVSVKTDL